MHKDFAVPTRLGETEELRIKPVCLINKGINETL